ncbi:MAG: YeeE/YedE thiosulfate transporter family protein [Gemmatimonadota bacterium]|nr:YeeE/YedE thiosulfate transporter family protein [Gemmatimonadota bacterium]
MLDILTRPWPWYVAGPLIGLVVPFIYWYGGKKWGVSSSLQHLCAAAVPSGLEYFRYDWKRRGGWHLAMAGGMLVGGFLGWRVLSRPDHVVAIAEGTREELTALGVRDFAGMVPSDLFSFEALTSVPGLVLVLLGGFLVGFGARYANGCTSGHAISGLSTLQRSSLVAVLGFFAGGLLTVHVLLPWVL